MKNLKISPKTNATVMMWTTLALMALIVLFATMPIITIDTTKASYLVPETSVNSAALPENVDVSIVKIIKSIKFMSNISSIASHNDKMINDDNYQVTEEKLEQLERMQEELDELMSTSEGAEIAFIAGTIVGKQIDYNINDTSDVGLALYLSVFDVFTSVGSLLLLMILIMLSLSVVFIVVLIKTLVNIKRPEKMVKTRAIIPSMIGIPLFVTIFVSQFNGISVAIGMKAIMIISILFAIFAAIFRRFNTNNPTRLKYINVLQGVSAVATIGFVVYLIGIINGHYILDSLLGKFISSMIDDLTASSIVAIVEFILILSTVIGFALFLLNRISCTIVPKKKSIANKHDSGLVSSIVLLVLNVIAIVKGSKLIVALVGIIIVVLAEIALKILTNKLCKGIGDSEINSIVCGYY